MSKTWHIGSAGLLLGLVLVAGSSPAAAADKKDPRPGDAHGAKVVKAGWWWAANEPPPETGLLAAPQPPSPTIPKGSVPVAAVGGDPDKVSAIEVKLRARPGSTVRSFDMVFRESREPGANANAENARILACPVTELFWADGSGAAWKDQPAYDCELASAKGKRTKKGLWRFDLADIAAGWLTPGSTASRSVVLVEDVDQPESFQVTLDGVKDKGIGLDLAATAPPPGGGALPSGGPAGSAGAGTSSVGGSSGGGGGPALSGGGPVPLAGDPGKQAAEPAAQEKPRALNAVPMAATPAWYHGIPRAGYLLLPLVLGLAYLLMLALGPDARPAVATGRHGVSRALDRLRRPDQGTGRPR